MADFTHIKALSFDADQTLWDFGGVYRQALDATVSAMVDRGDATASEATSARLIQVRDELVESFRGAPHNLEDVREQSFAIFLEEVGHANPAQAAADLVQIYMQVRFGAIELYAEVAEVLDRLKPQFQLGLLTNGNTYPDRCGLPGVFDAVVLGPDHGFEKPNPLAFQTLARELDVDCDQIMHIGDDWDDIEGANAVGAISVHINRTNEAPDFTCVPRHTITNLVDLEVLLTR